MYTVDMLFLLFFAKTHELCNYEQIPTKAARGGISALITTII